MQLFIRGLFCAVLALTVTSNASLAEKRVALVIGNGTYKNVPALPNPPKDATAISALLRNLGFNVVTGTNLTRDGFSDRLRQFADTAQGADVAVFFYAGHGMSLDGKNYLLPIDANLKSELDVKLGGPIDVETMLQQTMNDAKVKLVFLDACRDNPFVAQISRSVRSRSVAVSSGLSEMKSGEGTLLAFATGPGQVALDGDGSNSPFTKALLDNLAAPGMEIRLALTKVRAQVADTTQKKQLPWENTNLTGFFFMNPTAKGNASTIDSQQASIGVPSATATAESSGVAAAATDVEVEFWRSVKDSNKREELNAYLTRYPNGSFGPLARARLAKLDSGAKEDPSVTRTATHEIDPATKTEQASRSTEDDLDLDRDAKREVQRRLTALGFATPVNGRFTDPTRTAITNWQTVRGYPVSGFLNKLQYAALKAEALPKTAEKEPETTTRSSRRQNNSGGGNANQGNGGIPGAAVGGFVGGVMGGMFRR